MFFLRKAPCGGGSSPPIWPQGVVEACEERGHVADAKIRERYCNANKTVIVPRKIRPRVPKVSAPIYYFRADFSLFIKTSDHSMSKYSKIF